MELKIAAPLRSQICCGFMTRRALSCSLKVANALTAPSQDQRLTQRLSPTSSLLSLSTKLIFSSKLWSITNFQPNSSNFASVNHFYTLEKAKNKEIENLNNKTNNFRRKLTQICHTMNVAEALLAHPSREHIDRICHRFQNTNAKHNDNQEIRMEMDKESGIATICIKSGAKNAISAKMMSDFLHIMDELYAWDEGRGVLLYGDGGFFCSGGDLVTVRELLQDDDGINFNTLMRYNLTRLQNLPMLTIALIQGKAIGGGAEIAVASDMRVMTKSAKIGYVHSRVGICSAWGGGSRLVQLVGPSRAVEMMTSGRNVSASEAIMMGLANHIIEDCDESDLAGTLASAKAYLCLHMTGSKSTMTAIKAMVNAARHLPLEQALVVEGQLLNSVWGHPPHLKALSDNVKHRDE